MILNLLTGSTGSEENSILSYVFIIILCILACMLAFTFHEFGQTLCARLLGDKSANITANPVRQLKRPMNWLAALIFTFFGGCWKKQTVNNLESRWKRIILSLSGILSGIIFAAISSIAIKLLLMLQSSELFDILVNPFVQLFVYLFAACVILTLFSLFPLPPCDMGYLIAACLPENAGNTIIKTEQFMPVVIVIISVIMSRSGFITNILSSASDYANMLFGMFI